jgi:hypothetical protein
MKKKIDINIFDCETYEKNTNVYVYCICYSIKDEIYSIYKNQAEDIIITFLNEVITKSSKKKTVFYVHNINFDGMLIMDSIFKNNLKFEWFIVDTNIYFIKIEYLGNLIEFRCSYKFIPISLKNLDFLSTYKTIFPYKFVKEDNLNYIGPVPDISFFNENVSKVEYNNFFKNSEIFDLKKKTIEYCVNDVKLTLELLNKVLNAMDFKYIPLFKKSYSLPSLSYKIFFRYWNSFKIKEKILKEEDIYIRKSYYGGRCEVFGNSEKNHFTHYFDFSGMYEQCMKQKFPIGQGFFKNSNLNYKNIGFHSIKFESNMDYPILPYHSENGKLIFANGIFSGCYWYQEIELFVINGGKILEIYSSYEFEKEDYVFKEFINEFSEIKKRGGVYKIFGKLIINSLYGSMAMNEKDYESFICFTDKEAEKINEQSDVLEYYKKNNCHLFKIIKNKKSNLLLNKEELRWSNSHSNRNVIYASCISSKARIKLYLALKEVLKSGGKLLYCDTDSIAASYKEVKLNEQFGEVKWMELWKDSIFIAPKLYGYKNNKNEEIIKIKGISNNKYSLEELKKTFFSNKKSLTYKKELNFTKKKFNLKQNYIEKIVLINSYDKRRFTKDKLNTKALNITHPINE